MHLFSVILRRHTPATDACYYNDYDFYDLTAKKCVETPVRALRQVAFHSKKPFVFVVLECFSEKPASALATAIGMKLVIGKGRETEKAKEDRKGKRRYPKVPLEEKAVQFWGMFGYRIARRCERSRYLCTGFFWSVQAGFGWVSLDWVTPRDRVCACTDSGSLTTWLKRSFCHSSLPYSQSRDSCSHCFLSALLSSRIAAVARLSLLLLPPPWLKGLRSIIVVLHVVYVYRRQERGGSFNNME